MSDNKSQSSPKTPSEIENDLLKSDSEENVANAPQRTQRMDYDDVFRTFEGFRRNCISPARSEASTSTVSNKRLRNSFNDLSGSRIKSQRYNPLVEEVASNLNSVTIRHDNQSPTVSENATFVEAPNVSSRSGGFRTRGNQMNSRPAPYVDRNRDMLRINSFSGRTESLPRIDNQHLPLRHVLNGFGSVSMVNFRAQENRRVGRHESSPNNNRIRLADYEFPRQQRRSELPFNQDRAPNLNVSSIVQRRGESSLNISARAAILNNNPNHNTNAQRNQIVRDITAQRFHFFVVPVEYPYAVVDAELERRFDAEVQQILDSSQGNPLLNVEFLRGRLGAIPVTCYGNRAANVLTTLIQRLSIRPRLAPLRAIAINQFVPASICELRIPNQSEDFDQAIEHLRATNPGTELYSESWRLITASIGNRQNRSGTTFTFASDRALEVRIREYDARRREHSFILLSYSRGCGHASIRLNARYVDNSVDSIFYKQDDDPLTGNNINANDAEALWNAAGETSQPLANSTQNDEVDGSEEDHQNMEE